MNPELFPPSHDGLSDTKPVKRLRPQTRKKIALWLTFGPAGLFLGTCLLFMMVAIGYAFALGLDGTEDLFTNPPALIEQLGLGIQAAAVIAMLTGPPALIVGIIMLATQKKYTQNYTA